MKLCSQKSASRSGSGENSSGPTTLIGLPIRIKLSNPPCDTEGIACTKIIVKSWRKKYYHLYLHPFVRFSAQQFTQRSTVDILCLHPSKWKLKLMTFFYRKNLLARVFRDFLLYPLPVRIRPECHISDLEERFIGYGTFYFIELEKVPHQFLVKKYRS